MTRAFRARCIEAGNGGKETECIVLCQDKMTDIRHREFRPVGTRDPSLTAFTDSAWIAMSLCPGIGLAQVFGKSAQVDYQ